MKRNPFLFVALDGLTEKTNQTLNIAGTLASSVVGNYGFKVNLDYFLMCGVDSALKTIHSFGKPIFADLKMWNGGRTMAKITEFLSDRVEYINAYALAGRELNKMVEVVRDSKTKILALTILTHYNEKYCQENFGKSLKDTVRYFCDMGIKAGCHGVILPGTVLEAVNDLEVDKVVPGVRPKWFTDTRHEEEVEPRVAVDGGASILVCGSPVMKSPDPIEALQKILSEMEV